MGRTYVEHDVCEFEHLIDCMRTSVEVGVRKPDIKGYMEIADHFGLKPDEILFVGDEKKDIVGAKEVGMTAVLINRENDTKCYGEDLKINQYKDLVDYIESKGGGKNSL